MVKNRKRRAALGTCPFYLVRPHLSPAAWCKHFSLNKAAASKAHWKEGSLPVGTNAPHVFWKESVLLKMQLWTSSNKPASLTVTGSGDPKTRSKEAKAEKCIPFLMPQFRKSINSNLSDTSHPSPGVTGLSGRAHTWWLDYSFMVIVSAVTHTFPDPVTASLVSQSDLTHRSLT